MDWDWDKSDNVSRRPLLLGYHTLQAGLCDMDSCGANGLPVTPDSVSVVGNFASLLQPVNHPNLVKYLDVIRLKNERVSIIFEHYDSDGANLLNGNAKSDAEGDQLDPAEDNFNSICDILHGLHHLHEVVDCYHGLINPSAIVSNGERLKLTNWGLNLLTEMGSLVSAKTLLPNDLRYIPPEQVIAGQHSSKKGDIWSAGLVLLQWLYPSIQLPKNPAILAISKNVDEVFIKLKLNANRIPTKWHNFFSAALNPDPKKRAPITQLLEILLIPVPDSTKSPLENFIRPNCLRPGHQIYQSDTKLSLDEIYHLWCLSCGGRNHILNDDKKTAICPPIFNLPQIVPLIMDTSLTSSNDSNSLSNKKPLYIPGSPKVITLHALKERLKELDPCQHCPLIFSSTAKSPPLEDNHKVAVLHQELPLAIRESDFLYQANRLCLFKRLISGAPFLNKWLVEAATHDIAPYFRSRVWASLLGVKWSDLLIYERIDKVAPTATDRQISVDIPRCHQYNDFLASPRGHEKLTRVLKAWLAYNEKEYVYWQGLDSLAAPFVVLNFGDEAMAFASFNKFVHKYLRGFFHRDNSATIQEYLALFSHLIAYHDAKLFNHLDGLNFTPELYAIPWFLTMFTHVLPLHKIMHVWDTLLLGDETFPLCIGLAILEQLRDQLLEFNFNDCILIFSDLPEINIEDCLKQAVKYYQATPSPVIKRDEFPLEILRSEIFPRIPVKELISLRMGRDRERVTIIDGRDDGENMEPIEGAIFIDPEDPQQDMPPPFRDDLIVVVANGQLAYDLVRKDYNHVCLVEFEGSVPEQLTLKKNGK